MTHDLGTDRAVMMRKVLWRVLPLPFLLGLISIIDRTNVGYAALQMNAEIGLSDTAYGFGAGILFFGYFILEIPSNVALERFGARRWLARIAVSWGLISALTAFVWDEWSFYIARFLLGAAEAGLFPGVVLYLTYWVPAAYRAKAMSAFMACIPVSVVIGGPFAGWLLGHGGLFGMAGWQLIFLFGGLPAIVLGVITWFGMTDRPADARWLTPTERRTLESTLQAEAAATADAGRGRLVDAFRNRHVWIFTVAYFCYACGSYGVSLFLPQIIKQFDFSDLQVGFISAVPYLAGLVAMVLVARRSDRTGERRLHFGVPMLVAGAGLLGTGLTLDVPVVALLFMVVAVCGLMSSVATFWPRPTALISGTVAVAGIAVINSVGNIGGFVGPYAVGFLTDHTGGTFTAALVFLTALCAIGGVLTIVLRTGADRQDPVRPDAGTTSGRAAGRQ